MNNNFTRNILIFISPLIFRLLLDVVFYSQFLHIYGYVGYVIDTSITYYVLSWIFLIPFLFFHYNFCFRYKFSSVVAVLFLFASVIPNTTLYAFMPVKGMFLVWLFVYWFLFYLILYIFPDFFTSKMVRVPIYVPIGVLILISSVILYVSFRYTSLRLWVNIYDVYYIRWDQETWGLPSFFNYIIMAASIILPFFFVFFLSKRLWILAFTVIFFIFLNYGIGGHKSVLFSFIVALIGYFFFSYNRLKYIGVAFIAVPVFSFLEQGLFGSTNILALMIHRGFFIPSRITQVTYHFFQSHELDLYRQKFMRRFGFRSPYDMNIDHLISGFYFNDYGSGANNGLFSDAYSNLGVIGVLIIPVVLVIILKLFDLCSASINAKLLFGVIVSCFIALFSVSFSIALLSNGLIIMMLVLYSVGFSSSPAFKGRLLFISKIIKTSK